jgi:hypothetical protein
VLRELNLRKPVTVNTEGFDRLKAMVREKATNIDLDLLLNNRINAYLDGFEVRENALTDSIKQRMEETDPKFARINKKLNAIEAMFIQQ